MHDMSYGFVIYLYICLVFLFVAITIGLDFDRVTVYEDVGMTELCASTNDELEREVVVSVVYQDRGAFGEGRSYLL